MAEKRASSPTRGGTSLRPARATAAPTEPTSGTAKAAWRQLSSPSAPDIGMPTIHAAGWPISAHERTGRRRPGADEERDADADHRLRKDEQLETLRDGTGDCAAGDQPGAAKQQRLQPYAPASTRKPESGHPGGEPGRGSNLARGGGGDMEVRRDAREDRRNRDQAGLGGEERREEGDAHAAVVEVLCRVVRVHLGGSPSRC